MSNDFKFRVWDIKNKKFLLESQFAILGNGKLIVTPSGYYNHFTNSSRDEYVIHQYTTCRDSSNKEIYEGDFVEYTDGDITRSGYINFIAGIFIFTYYDDNYDIELGYLRTSNLKVIELGYLRTSNLKVIGNIFETPELLKFKNSKQNRI